MTALIISDLHLALERPEVTQAFFDFLHTRATQADSLYILGDLFEVWIGDDDPSPFTRDVITELKKLSDSGTKLYFQHGNRDFMIGKRFATETGCVLLPDVYLADLSGIKAILLHGDTLCTKDEEYQKFRRIARSFIFKWVMKTLSLSRRQKIASNWRSKSMAANSNKASNIMDVTPDEVEKLLLKHNVTTMIHGHTHRPARHTHKNGERIVLGDWHKTGWVVIAENGELELSEFAI